MKPRLYRAERAKNGGWRVIEDCPYEGGGGYALFHRVWGEMKEREARAVCAALRRVHRPRPRK